MFNQRNMPSFTGVASGSAVVLDLPLGLTYKSIVLIQGGTTFTRAQLKNIVLEVDGAPLQSYKDADRLQAINKFYQRADTANFTTLHFDRRELVELAQRRAPGIGTFGLRTLQLRADIDSGAVAPTLAAYAIIGPQSPPGLVTAVRELSYSGAAGQWEIDNLPRSLGSVIAMHINKSDVTALEVLLDNRKVFEGTKAVIDQIQVEHKRTPQTGYTHVDWTLEGDLYDSLDASDASEWRIKPTTTAAGATPIIIEYLADAGAL